MLSLTHTHTHTHTLQCILPRIWLKKTFSVSCEDVLYNFVYCESETDWLIILKCISSVYLLFIFLFLYLSHMHISLSLSLSCTLAEMPDPFAKIVVDGSGQCHSTDIIKSTLDPKWNQHYDL